MRFLIPFISFSIILIFSTSCEEINEIFIDKNKILASVEVDSELFESLEYDDEGRISQRNIYSSFSLGLIYYLTYEYDKDEVTITFINNSDGIVFRIEKIYDENRKTVRKDIYNSINGTDLTGYRLYHYNGNSCGASEIETYAPNGTMTERSTYAYYNVNCGQYIKNYNSDDSLVSMIYIERDDMKHPYTSTDFDIFKFGKRGNITKYTYMNADSIVNPALSYFSYFDDFDDYEELDYAALETRQYQNGNEKVLRFFYQE